MDVFWNGGFNGVSLVCFLVAGFLAWRLAKTWDEDNGDASEG